MPAAQCGRAPPSSPAARATIGSDDLILLATGAASWPELLSSGRFELTGDPFLALRFASLFRLPVELDPGLMARPSGIRRPAENSLGWARSRRR